jgi:hypothetical protein
MARITINGISLDPVVQSRALRAAALESADASESNYILVQTQDPLSESQRAELTELGVEIHEYVPENTYLCGYQPTDLDAIRALSFVTWADVYLRGFKIAPALRQETPDSRTAIVPTDALRSPSRKPVQIDVVLHENVDTASDSVTERVAVAAGQEPSALRVGRHKVRVTIQEGALADLAALDEVRSIERAPQRQLFNNVARPILHADVVVNGTGYEGEGEIVAVADTGFDRGSIDDVHPAFAGRVRALYPLGRPTPADASDPHGHGTHVAGTVLGDGNSASMGGPIRGTAPRATLVLQSTLDEFGGLGGLPIDLHDLFEPPYDDDGARVHTNSWGAVTPGLPYDSSAMEIDDTVWNRQDLVICFAAGNDGTDRNKNGVVDAGSIGSQSAAKNCITVGASESSRPDFRFSYGEYWPADFPTDPINSDRQANTANGLVAFSSRGPTREGRIKPDVVAPGTCILSTLSRSARMSATFGTSSDPLYFFDSGTSMATPLVAGCVAVVRETLVRNGTPTPSAALIKALLINGATELPGQYSPSEAGVSPNNNSGFGLVDLAGSVIIPGVSPDAGFGEAGPLELGAEDEFAIDIEQGDRGNGSNAAGRTLKVTLVWTDPPGASLQNDLDLIVRAEDGTERHGNMGVTDLFDRTNNVEQVRWTGVPHGKAIVTIRAFRITKFAQPYAYAWRLS